jgi:hypothetical protein
MDDYQPLLIGLTRQLNDLGADLHLLTHPRSPEQAAHMRRKAAGLATVMSETLKGLAEELKAGEDS